MKKKRICLAVVMIVALSIVLFFTVPRALLPKGEIELLSVELCDGTDETDITDRLDAELLLEQLQSAQCRRILDASYNYLAEDACYEITVRAGEKGSFHILLGEPDEKGETSLMNKGYYPTQKGIFPTLRYKVLDPDSLIAWLDAAAA